MGLQLGRWSDQREAKALVGVVQILQPSAQFYQWVAGSHKTHWTRLAGQLASCKVQTVWICTNQIWMIMCDWDRDRGVHNMFGGSAMNMLVLHSTTNKQCFPPVVLSHLAGASKTSFTATKFGKCFQGDVVIHLDWNLCKCRLLPTIFEIILPTIWEICHLRDLMTYF